jgi:hypothetical protein
MWQITLTQYTTMRYKAALSFEDICALIPNHILGMEHSLLFYLFTMSIKPKILFANGRLSHVNKLPSRRWKTSSK